MPNRIDNLGYHDYAALICSLNDEAQIRMRPDVDGQREVQQVFLDVVRGYRERLEAEFDEVRRANRQRFNHRLKHYLYNPIRHHAFGYTDYLNLVLVDDFDSLFRLTTSLSLPVNQVVLAFAPRLGSLGLPQFGAPVSPQGRHRQLFAISARWAGVPEENWASSDLQLPFCCDELHRMTGPPGTPVHDFQTSHPLMLMARLNLSGIAALGEGLRLRRAVFRLVAAKILQTQIALVHDTGPATIDLELTPEVVKNARVVLLDAQGPEEVAIYFNVQNYSLAVAMLASITGATWRELIEVGEIVPADLPLNGRLHSLLAERGGATWLEDNHVFSSTYSVAGRTDGDVLQFAGQLSGFVEVYVRGNVVAGHLHDAEQTLLGALPRAGSTLNISTREVHRHLIGRYDLDFSMAWLNEAVLSLIGVKEFFRRADRIRHQLKVPRTNPETGFLEISSGIVVPLPKLSRCPLVRPIGERDASSIDRVQRVVHAAFGTHGPLDKSKLQTDALAKLHLPIRLERSMLYLFKSYHDSLLDPLLFDEVLDLHPTMVTLYDLILKDLPRHAETMELIFEPREAGLRREVLFHEQIVDPIREAIEATHDSLMHRIRRYSRVEQHDWDVGFRGGLTQIVQGAAPRWEHAWNC